MTIRVPDQGEEIMLDLITSVNYSLRLFKNDVAESDALTEADLTVADFAGYASVTLTGGSWTTTPGGPSVAAYAEQTFTRSSTGAAQSIYGYYLVRSSDSKLVWLEKFASAVVMELVNDNIRVTPRLTLRDEVDA